MSDLKSEALTILFTDIEGSKRLWEVNPGAMRAALRDHDDLLRTCIESRGGHLFKTMGDASCAAFANPRSAVDAVLAAHLRLSTLALTTAVRALTIKVRMALKQAIELALEVPGA
jgi:class 3 adenylate cyclase